MWEQTMKAATEEEKFWLSFDLVTEEIIESLQSLQNIYWEMFRSEILSNIQFDIKLAHWITSEL